MHDTTCDQIFIYNEIFLMQNMQIIFSHEVIFYINNKIPVI